MTKTLDSMVNEFETSLLKAMDEYQNVTRAIEAKDQAAIVRAGLRALKRSDMISKFAGAAELKSAAASNRFRREGNDLYRRRRFKEARDCYNKALAFAPNNSLEMKLAYSNTSAVLLATSSFKSCQLNIKTALEMNCPESLRIKLKKRLIEADKHVMEEIVQHIVMSSDEDLINFADFDVERNDEIPCVSTDVCVDDGKNVVAAKEIKSGTMVARERAYVSNQDKSTKYSSCYYCHKISSFFIPCEGCSKALFCSKQCKEKCFEDFHRIECHFVGFMYKDSSDINQELNKLAVKAALQMSLKLGWEELRVASLEMGEKLFKKSSVAEAFDCNNPTSLLCYDDQAAVPINTMINKSLFCAGVIHLISKVPNYWPKDKKEKENAIDSLSRIILHLNTTFKRRIVIPSTVVNEPDGIRHMGWFSFASKLAHSCEPNLIVLGANDTVALIAVQRIKKGDLLTISYIDHFYDMKLVPSPKNTCIRQKIIKSEIDYKCECRVCLLEWETNSAVPGKLISRQNQAYRLCKLVMRGRDFKPRMEAIGAALDELTGCINTTQHRSVYDSLKETLSIYQCVTLLNSDLHPL